MKFRKDANDDALVSELPEILLKVLSSLEAESMILLPGDIPLFQSDAYLDLDF